MTSNQVTAKNFNASNISCTEPKKNKKKRLQAYLLYDYGSKNSPLYLETPEALVCPFGLSIYEAVEDSGVFSYSLPMTMKSSIASEQPVVDSFLKQLQELDEFMVDYGIRYSKHIFGKEYTESHREIVREFYSPLIKEQKVNADTGEPYPYRISPKIKKVWEDTPTSTNGVPNVEVYTSSEADNQPESWDSLNTLLPGRVSSTGILSLRPWFVNKKFGLSMTLLKLKVMPVERNEAPRGYSFSRPPVAGESTTEDTVEETQESAGATTTTETTTTETATTEASASSQSVSEEEVEDSDEELVDEEDVEDVEEAEEVEEVHVTE